MKLNIPSRISRMSKRRQKVALKAWIQKDLQPFVGKPNSPLLRADVERVIMSKFAAGIHAYVVVQPVAPVERIDLKIIVGGAA